MSYPCHTPGRVLRARCHAAKGNLAESSVALLEAISLAQKFKMHFLELLVRRETIRSLLSDAGDHEELRAEQIDAISVLVKHKLTMEPEAYDNLLGDTGPIT